MAQKAIYLAIVAIIALTAIYSVSTPKAEPAAVNLSFENLMANAQCTEELALQCAVEIEKTVVACAKAFETEGIDIIADIKCAKDLMADKKFCWPCICYEAKKKGWHIIGC